MNEIKEAINTIFDGNADGVSFIPTEDEDGLRIDGFQYKKKYKQKVSDLGNFYHIICYKVCEESGKVINHDNFIAILTDPRVYVSNLIQCNFYGIVLKQTSGSKNFAKTLYEKILIAA